MKKAGFILFCLLTIAVNVCSAQNASASYKQGNDFYAGGKFAEAAESYSKAAKTVQSPEIYYNLGNACYKQKDLAHAILSYERALRLNPEFEKAKENLSIANSRIADKIEPTAKQKFSSIWKSFIKHLGVKTFAEMCLIFWTLGGILLAMFLLSHSKNLKKFGFFGGFVFVGAGLLFLYLSFSTLNEYQDENSAIITGSKVDVKSAPNESGTNIFVLHEGAKISVHKTEGQWCEISIASGNIGWIPLSVFEKI